jgi:hypothetical protein
MPSGLETQRKGSWPPPALLLVSSVLVLLTAIGFDVLAEEPPVHTLAVALAAVIVGLGRVRAQTRHREVFAAVNLAVVGQPAVHALGKMTHAGAELLPHGHGLPEGLAGVALHVAVALLVVGVAASEPLGVFVVTTVSPVLAKLIDVRPLPAIGPAPVAPVAFLEPRAPTHRLLFTRQACRRGPPPSALLAV